MNKDSALELFALQVAAGGPVTVTDPTMTRFVMTTDRAVELAMAAAEVARGGEVFVFKMPVARLAMHALMCNLQYGDRYHYLDALSSQMSADVQVAALAA